MCTGTQAVVFGKKDLGVAYPVEVADDGRLMTGLKAETSAKSMAKLRSAVGDEAIAGVRASEVEAIAGVRVSDLEVIAGVKASEVEATAGVRASDVEVIARVKASEVEATAGVRASEVEVIAGVKASEVEATAGVRASFAKATASSMLCNGSCPLASRVAFRAARLGK